MSFKCLGRTSKKSTRSSKADVKSEPSSSDKKASPKASPTLVDAATQTDRDVAMSDNSFSISSSDPTQTVKPDITLSAEPELTEIQFVHPPMPTIVPGGDFEDSSVLVLGRPPGVGFKAASAPGVALKPAVAAPVKVAPKPEAAGLGGIIINNNNIILIVIITISSGCILGCCACISVGSDHGSSFTKKYAAWYEVLFCYSSTIFF
jgi:hypothetical protein